MNVEWNISRLGKDKIEAANEAGNARFIFTESADGSWEGRCISVNAMNQAFSRLGLSAAEMTKEAARLSRSAGDAVLEYLKTKKKRKKE